MRKIKMYVNIHLHSQETKKLLFPLDTRIISQIKAFSGTELGEHIVLDPEAFNWEIDQPYSVEKVSLFRCNSTGKYHLIMFVKCDLNMGLSPIEAKEFSINQHIFELDKDEVLVISDLESYF